jgi:hypothetical protein
MNLRTKIISEAQDKRKPSETRMISEVKERRKLLKERKISEAQEKLLQIIDLLIQRKDYLALFPYYHSLDFVRKYADREDKQALLGGSFYLNYYLYIRDLVLETDFEELGNISKFISNPYAMCVFIDAFVLKFEEDKDCYLPAKPIMNVVGDIYKFLYNSEVEERLEKLKKHGKLSWVIEVCHFYIKSIAVNRLLRMTLISATDLEVVNLDPREYVELLGSYLDGSNEHCVNTTSKVTEQSHVKKLRRLVKNKPRHSVTNYQRRDKKQIRLRYYKR